MSDLKPEVWQFFSRGKWHTGMNCNNHKQNTIDADYPVRDLYPINDINKIKADAVREALKAMPLVTLTCAYELNQYADELERGEL